MAPHRKAPRLFLGMTDSDFGVRNTQEEMERACARKAKRPLRTGSVVPTGHRSQITGTHWPKLTSREEKSNDCSGVKHIKPIKIHEIILTLKKKN